MLFKNIRTVDENWNVLEGMNVLTEGTRITYIGKEMPKDYNGPVTDGDMKFLMPGFYNTHCHVPMTLLRGQGTGLPLDRWLNEAIFPVEAKLTPDDIYFGALLGIMELLSSGVVSVSDMYFRIPRYASALEEAGIKGNLCNGVVCFDPSASYFDDRSFRELLELDYMAKSTDGRIVADVGIHSEYTTTEKVVREAAEYAKTYGRIIQIHVSETEKEHRECKARHGGLTPTAYLKKCGVLESPAVMAHCVQCEKEDLDLIYESGAFVAHNISSNLKLGSGIATTPEWMNMDINVTIGTDGAASNNNLNFMEELHLAAMVATGVTRDPQAVSPAYMFKAASRTGALAQGRKDCGLMKEGMRADLIMFDLDKPHLLPERDLIANILYSAQSSDICMTMVDGKIVYRDGAFPGIDRERVCYEVRKRQERLLKEAGF